MAFRSYGRSRYARYFWISFPCDNDDSNLFDVDIDSPIQLSAPAAGNAGFEPDPDQVAMLSDMGFTNAQARKALRETVSPPYISSIF